MLNWSQRFNIFCFLDNQDYTIQPHHYECLLAAGATHAIDAAQASFPSLDAFLSNQSWAFGHLSYNLGQPWYGLPIALHDTTGFPDFFFFQPQYLIRLVGDHVFIEGPDADQVFEEIQTQEFSYGQSSPVIFQSRFTKESYIETINKLQQHIQLGDCYEINFCQEFYAKEVNLNPIHVFQKLLEVSPNPFSALYKVHDSYLLCASPERFLCKEGNKLFSQPIKGTGKRFPANREQDIAAKEALYNSNKDRSENVMVVDLVRNDLSKVCEEGSVQVEELFGIYAFPQVHQMISTISGVLKPDIPFTKIIKATFPMGSMTGAPKKKVMELIQQYEIGGRGIFSGSVGYINPDGNFDFNVVIRSIMYNTQTKFLSYQVGSGITIYSNPEQEWEECLLKAEAIKKVLT
ncbi:MAG TPA: anthranilate synthase component I family protein [Flavisolibacter sp.]|nr:anthranilate synthase component I family protein [Flavisolibacter sp.]